jgi:hypothetical protein
MDIGAEGHFRVDANSRLSQLGSQAISRKASDSGHSRMAANGRGQPAISPNQPKTGAAWFEFSALKPTFVDVRKHKPSAIECRLHKILHTLT